MKLIPRVRGRVLSLFGKSSSRRDAAAPDWPVWLVAGVAFINGLLEILWVQEVRIPDRAGLSGLLPFGLHYWNRSLSLLFGFTLIYLSLNLLWRKRMAWWLAVASSVVVVASHAVHGLVYERLPYEELVHHRTPWYATLDPVLVFGLLFLFRKRFTVRSEPQSIVRGLGVLVASVLLAVAYGTLGFWLLDERDLGTNFHLVESFVMTLRAYTLMGNGSLIPYTPQADWFLDSLGWTGLITGGFALYSLFRPLAYRLRTLPQERQEARSILQKHGTSSLDFFKLWPDKSYFFSEDRRSFIAYRVAGGVAFALGDPVGTEQDLEDVTRGFLRFCSDNSWGVAFHEVLSDLLPMYHRLGMRELMVGEEAILDLEHFRSKTVKRKWFRYIKRKFEEREGYRLIRYDLPHSRELLDEVEAISDEWLSLPGRRERGFTIGSFKRDYVGETRLFIVREPTEGRALAFVNQIPSYREGEATIDLMRHRIEIPNGVMDYLFIAVLLSLEEEGYRSFDLGLAPLSGVGECPGASLQERALNQISERLTRFFSYKGLKNYKAKFEPDWEKRFLVYTGGPPALAKIGIALTRVTEE